MDVPVHGVWGAPCEGLGGLGALSLRRFGVQDFRVS